MEVAVPLAVGRPSDHANPRRTPGSKLWVASYDVSDDRTRARLATRLGAYGQRTHYSVFELELDQRQAARIADVAAGLLRPLDAFSPSAAVFAVHGVAKGRPYPGSAVHNWHVV